MTSKITEEDINKYIQFIDINNEDKAKEMKFFHQRKGQKFIQIPIDYLILLILILIIIIINSLFIRGVYIQRTRLHLIKVKNKLEMSQVAGDIIINLIKKKPDVKIGLSSRNTPKRIYKYLIDRYEDGVVSFSNVTFFSLDEYCGLDFFSRETYDYFLRNNFLDHIDAKVTNIKLIKGSTDNCQKEADYYNELLNNNTIDLQLLSIGEDGHFGFNEPGTPFDSETHVTTFSNHTREKMVERFGYNLNKVPYYGITQGIDNIMNAKNILLVVGGKKKAKGIKSLFRGKPTEELPISALKYHLGNVYVVADDDACSMM